MSKFLKFSLFLFLLLGDFIMLNQKLDQCLKHLNSAQSLLDLSLIAVNHPDKSVNLQSLEQCLALCQSHLNEVRRTIQDNYTVINAPIATSYEQ